MSNVYRFCTAAALFVVLLAGAIAVHGQTCPQGPAAPVQTQAGPVCGTTSSVSVPGKGTFTATAYLGLRYAQPPSRWQNALALPANSWTTPVQATQIGNICPQSGPSGSNQPPNPQCTLPSGQSEDCLFLNVWLPPTSSTKPLPVMVFIHGGAFFFGAGSGATYNGTYMAAQENVIVVTLNYRLGSLGFLNHAGFMTTDPSNNNFGFRDQLLALQWVHDNIAAFGGDPANVTIFGQSAGAMSVGLHALGGLQSQGLFKSAIMESNPLGLPYKTMSEATQLAEKLTKLLGCSNSQPASEVACLMKQPACLLVQEENSGSLAPGLLSSLLQRLSQALLWAPAVGTDGTAKNPLTTQPLQATSLPVPLILGTNLNEGDLFVDLKKQQLNLKSITPLAYSGLLTSLFPLSASKIEAKYPVTKSCASTPCDQTQNLDNLFTDFLFTCANQYLANNLSAATTPPLYTYQFTQTTSNTACNLSSLAPECAGPNSQVCHGNELIYVFGTPEELTSCTFSTSNPNEQIVSDAMVGAWTSFGKTQIPSGLPSAWPAWTAFTQSANQYMIFNQSPALASAPLAASGNGAPPCSSLWNSFYSGPLNATFWSRALTDQKEVSKP